MKIALFGGSFDPPHAGHDAAVKAILSSLKPDLLVIMPSFLNPFKKSFSAPPQLRLRWCRALWSDAPRIEVSDYEISQNRSVPTIQSVKFLLEKYRANGKITSETTASASETPTAVTDRALTNGANIANKISAGAYTPGSADEILPERTDGALSCDISKILSSDVCSADITGGTSIPANAKNEALQGGMADQISVGSKSEMDGISQSKAGEISADGRNKAGNANDASKILNADKIPSGNTNCMTDMSDTNCMNVANDVHYASDVSSADEVSKANSANHIDTAPKLYIVVGADNLAELHKWRDFSELQRLAEFVVLTRPGYEIPRQWAALRRIEIVVDTSSSGFRRDFKGEIPPKIAAEVIKFYKRKDMQDPKQRAERIAEILNKKKAEDVQIIDMSEREYIAKLVVIATTLTSRHAASLIEELKSVLKPLGEEFLAIESGDEWSVVDLGDIIVHLISEAYRAKYNIEDFLDKLKKEQF
ncbi:ribosome silencing factor [Campylobacter gracilis]|uniref:ribosome silencing factor n=1 Tax=Campylobacter gracilis TaxID=824 RepID=UPI0026F04D09|nr:ribosome silencing factor [Campylobacter gracilis]